MTIVLEGGEQYTGQLDEYGMPHGDGVVHNNRFSFQGPFMHGLPWYGGVVCDSYNQPIDGYYNQDYIYYSCACDFVGGKRHGYGLERSPNGNRCEGSFADDLPDGPILFTFANGRQYVYEYARGIRLEERRASDADLMAARQRRVLAQQQRVDTAMESIAGQQNVADSQRPCSREQLHKQLEYVFQLWNQ